MFITRYLQLVLGMRPLEAGMWLMPSDVVFVIGSILAPVIVRRHAPSTILASGFLIAATGYAVLTQISANGDLWILILGFMLFCAGLAPMGALTTDLVMSGVPPERAGAVSGISETSFEFGAALGIAVLGSIVGAIYRAQMSGIALPELSAGMLREIRETLGAAIEIAASIEGGARSTLESAARNAFTRAMQVAAFVSSALTLAAAVVCWRFMSRRQAVMREGQAVVEG